MKPEPRLLRRKRVWPLLVLLLLLMFWFSRQTATVSPASKVTAAGPSESRLAAVAAEDLTGGDLSPFGGPDDNSSSAFKENGNPTVPAAVPLLDLSLQISFAAQGTSMTQQPVPPRAPQL